MEQGLIEDTRPQMQPIHWAMFMFLSLSQQAEGWAYVLKGQVNMRQKQVLNTYLNSARSLFNTWADKTDLFDELIENSTVWSDLMKMMMELPLHKQQALYAAMVEFIKGNIVIQDDDGNLVHTTLNP